MNFYELLQVRPTADQEVIEAAAKALLKKAHPDKGGEDALTKELIVAKNTLADAKLRADYNAKLRADTHGNVIGSYRLVRLMAEGGFGRVYEGIHTVVNEKVCIKHNINISNYDTQLFLKEARSIWNLRHHALPTIRDMILLEDGSCALIMTYIEGPTLLELVERYAAKKQLIDPENICWIMDRCLDALRYTHFNGVIHGDVKPQNIIVQPDHHTAVVVDFGLASIKPTAKSRPDGFTPLFAAPESLTDKPPLPESDLYSLGMTMIFALGGDVKTKKVPSSVPKPVRDFLSDLVVFEVNNRPHWKKVDLLEELRKVRIAAFGREHTKNKKL